MTDQFQRRFIVLTGGPGAGKTTLLDALAARGYATMPEAGRGVIRDQGAIDGPALPWRDRALFAELMLSWEMRSHAMADAVAGTVLFDRGVPDVIGYLRLCGLPVPDHVMAAARRCRYAPTVIAAPPWREIYVRDGERRQDFGEAERTFTQVVGAYRELGYAIALLPRASVEERVSYVEAIIAAAD